MHLLIVNLNTMFRMVFSPGWQCSNPTSLEIANISLIPVLHSRQDNLPPRPLMVLDKEGGTEAATYCALSNLFRSAVSNTF